MSREDAVELYCALLFADAGLARLLDPIGLIRIAERCDRTKDVALLAFDLADAAVRI